MTWDRRLPASGDSKTNEVCAIRKLLWVAFYATRDDGAPFCFRTVCCALAHLVVYSVNNLNVHLKGRTH